MVNGTWSGKDNIAVSFGEETVEGGVELTEKEVPFLTADEIPIHTVGRGIDKATHVT